MISSDDSLGFVRHSNLRLLSLMLFQREQQAGAMLSRNLLPRLSRERGFQAPQQIQTHVAIHALRAHKRGDRTDFLKLRKRRDARLGQHLLRLWAKTFKFAD